MPEQRPGTGGGNTRAPGRCPGRDNGLDGGELRGLRVDGDVPAEQHAARDLTGVPGRVLRAGGKRGCHPCHRGACRISAATFPPGPGPGSCHGCPSSQSLTSGSVLARHSAGQAWTTSSGAGRLPSPPGTPARGTRRNAAAAGRSCGG